MDIFEEVIKKIIFMAIIYLIINRALDNLSHRKKAVIIFFIGLTISGIFYLAYYLDFKNGQMAPEVYYLSYIGINLVIAFGTLIYNFIKYKKNKFDRYKYNRRTKIEPTSKVHFKEYLYLVFEYKNEYLFKKRKEIHSGLNFRLKKESFHDEEINSILRKHGADESVFNLVGKYTNNKTKEIHHVYLINLNVEINIRGCEFVQYSKVRFLEMNDFDKEIVYRVLIKEKFDIEKI